MEASLVECADFASPFVPAVEIGYVRGACGRIVPMEAEESYWNSGRIAPSPESNTSLMFS